MCAYMNVYAYIYYAWMHVSQCFSSMYGCVMCAQHVYAYIEINVGAIFSQLIRRYRLSLHLRGYLRRVDVWRNNYPPKGNQWNEEKKSPAGTSWLLLLLIVLRLLLGVVRPQIGGLWNRGQWGERGNWSSQAACTLRWVLSGVHVLELNKDKSVRKGEQNHSGHGKVP